MKKLLFLTSELPFPANSGGKLKSLELLTRLVGEYQVSLACPLKLDDRLHVTRFLADFRGLDQVLVRATDVPRSPINLLRSYLAGVPLNVLRTANAELAAEVAAIIDDFDVVFVDHYEAGQYLPASYDGQRVYH
ncbi:MAG: glycosyl transferase, partial [Halieaceae bacterium]|nr:glycosyl transferase [Halieaceae bacterium]